MIVDIKICVLPEIKKFIGYRYQVNPFILSKKNKYGIFLYHCLVKINSKVKESAFDIDTKKYSEVLTIRLSDDMWRRKGYYIHPQKQIDFNSLVSMEMDDAFYYHMEYYFKVQGNKIQHSIFSFRDKFGLTEDDVTLKCLEKKYERYRFGITA